MTPIAWFICCLAFSLVALACYLLNRPRLVAAKAARTAELLQRARSGPVAPS